MSVPRSPNKGGGDQQQDEGEARFQGGVSASHYWDLQPRFSWHDDPQAWRKESGGPVNWAEVEQTEHGAGEFSAFYHSRKDALQRGCVEERTNICYWMTRALKAQRGISLEDGAAWQELFDGLVSRGIPLCDWPKHIYENCHESGHSSTASTHTQEELRSLTIKIIPAMTIVQLEEDLHETRRRVFLWMVLSIKLERMARLGPESIPPVDWDTLYEKVLAEEVPKEEWPAWLERQMSTGVRPPPSILQQKAPWDRFLGKLSVSHTPWGKRPPLTPPHDTNKH